MRLIFCVVGDGRQKVTLEIASSMIEADQSEAGGLHPDDRLWGFSWRATDVEAAHSRLVAEGLDLSEVRKGRRPGTLVFSVRDGTCGVPTLVIGPERSSV